MARCPPTGGAGVSATPRALLLSASTRYTIRLRCARALPADLEDVLHAEALHRGQARPAVRYVALGHSGHVRGKGAARRLRCKMRCKVAVQRYVSRGRSDFVCASARRTPDFGARVCCVWVLCIPLEPGNPTHALLAARPCCLITSHGGLHGEDLGVPQRALLGARLGRGAVQQTLNGGQFDFVRPSAPTPRGANVEMGSRNPGGPPTVFALHRPCACRPDSVHRAPEALKDLAERVVAVRQLGRRLRVARTCRNKPERKETKPKQQTQPGEAPQRGETK